MKNSTTFLQQVGLILLGILITLIVLELGLRTGGMVYSYFQSRHNQATFDEQEFRILTIGESMTAMGGEYAYPRQLETILNQKSSDKKFKVINRALPSMTTPGMIAQLDTWIKDHQPHMIVSMMGINDLHYEKTESSVMKHKSSLRVVHFFGLLKLHIESTIREMRMSFAERAQYYFERKQYRRAERLIDQALAKKNNDVNALILAAKIYREKGMKDEAIKVLEKAAAINPNNEEIFYLAGLTLYQWDQPQAARDALIFAVNLNPKMGSAFTTLSSLGLYIDDQMLAAEALALALDLEFDLFSLYYYADHLYQLPHDVKKAEARFLQEIEDAPNHPNAYHALMTLYQHQGRLAEAEKIDQKRKASVRYFSGITHVSYIVLAEKVREHDIQLVAVQYPMLPLVPLQQMLAGEEDVVFVDNQASFTQAVAQEGFEAIFIDHFAGDFGHCTARGYNILAQNVASAVLGSGQQ